MSDRTESEPVPDAPRQSQRTRVAARKIREQADQNGFPTTQDNEGDEIEVRELSTASQGMEGQAASVKVAPKEATKKQTPSQELRIILTIVKGLEREITESKSQNQQLYRLLKRTQEQLSQTQEQLQQVQSQHQQT